MYTVFARRRGARAFDAQITLPINELLMYTSPHFLGGIYLCTITTNKGHETRRFRMDSV